MNHSDPIVRRLHACIVAGVATNLVGAPGVGKTARVLAYVKAQKGAMERMILSRCEPIDLKVRLNHEGKVVVVDAPEIERAARAGLAGVLSIIFFDELNRAERSTEGAALDIIDAPPAGVAVVAACNPPTKGQASRPLSSAAANRFCHLFVEADGRGWCDAQLTGWPIAGAVSGPDPDALAKAKERTSVLVSAFIRSNMALLECEPDNALDAGGPWPSPRTWEAVKRVHAVAIALGYDFDDIEALISGCVGKGAATSYMAYVIDAGTLDPEVVLADPEGWTPEAGKLDRTIVLVTGIVGCVARDMTADRWEAAWKVLGRCEACNESAAGMVGTDLLIGVERSVGARMKGLKSSAALMAKHTPRVAAAHASAI